MESLQRLMLKGVKLLLIIEVTGNIIGKEVRVQDKWKEFNSLRLFSIKFRKITIEIRKF